MARFPAEFRQSAPVVFNVDYFDYATNAGYKNFYPLICANSSGVQYILAPNSDIGTDSSYISFGGNASLSTDFDITFSNNATIAAADCTLSYVGKSTSSSGKTISVTATLYHVTAGGTETSLGSGIAETVSFSSALRKSVKFAVTRHDIAPGEKLRLTLDTVSNDASATLFIDPNGRTSISESGTGVPSGTATDSRMILSVPFEVDI